MFHHVARGEGKKKNQPKPPNKQTNTNIFPASRIDYIFPHPEDLTSLSLIPSISSLNLGLAVV